jgi:hypothetical protein
LNAGGYSFYVSAKALRMFALLALVATCKEELPARPDPGIVTDGGFAGAPGRNVIEDLPDGFFNDSPVGDAASPIGSRPIGGGGSGGSDGPSRRDAARTPDRPATSGCNLLRQDCELGKGCYPATSGNTGVCQNTGDQPEGANCFEHADCAPSYICVEGFGAGGSRQCMKICDPMATYACAGSGCQVYGTSAIGFCRP